MDINMLLNADLRERGWRIASLQFKEETGETGAPVYEPARTEIILARALPVAVNAENTWGNVVVVASGVGVSLDDAMMKVVAKIYNGTPKPGLITLEVDQ